MGFPFLFSPIKINRMELKNRIVMTAMHLHYDDDNGYVNDRLIHFYTRRAEGGVGLIIVGTCCIDKDTSPPIFRVSNGCPIRFSAAAPGSPPRLPIWGPAPGPQ